MDIETEMMPYVGVPYKWSMDGKDGEEGSRAPFWRTPVPPTPKEVNEEGCCCVGLINIYLLIKGLPTFEGTGHVWVHFKDVRKNMGGEIPVGALLMLPYKDVNNQGHVGIALSGGRVLHCYSYEGGPQPGLHRPGVKIEELCQEDWAGWVGSETWLAAQ